MRAAWATHERRARQALCTADARALEDVGILHEPHASCADHDLIHRRRQQIGALDRLRALTEHARQTAPDTR